MTQDEIDRYFRDHIPYRLKLLLEYVDNDTASPPMKSHAHFIASIITGRLILQFLGIGTSSTKQCLVKYRPGDDDVNVTHLGGQAIEISTLGTGQQQAIYDYMVMANKAAAHFTMEMPHDYDDAHRIALVIFRLLQQHLYNPTNRPCPSFTSLGFTNLATNANEHQ